MRGEKKEKRKREEKKEKMQARAILTFYNLNPTGEAVLPNVFQNGSNSTREATPTAEPEPELFLEEPEPCQTGPKEVNNWSSDVSLPLVITLYCICIF
jgi:hypothetical protein